MLINYVTSEINCNKCCFGFGDYGAWEDTAPSAGAAMLPQAFMHTSAQGIMLELFCT